MEKTLLDEFAMAALTGMFSDPSRMATSDNYAREAYKYAQAMMEERKTHIEVKDNGWIEWSGGERPINELEMVEVMYRNGRFDKFQASRSRWDHLNNGFDIIKYRVLK